MRKKSYETKMLSVRFPKKLVEEVKEQIPDGTFDNMVRAGLYNEAISRGLKVTEFKE